MFRRGVSSLSETSVLLWGKLGSRLLRCERLIVGWWGRAARSLQDAGHTTQPDLVTDLSVSRQCKDSLDLRRI